MIVALRTDKPEAELVLLDDVGEEVAREEWLAHRQLAETIHGKLQSMLDAAGVDYEAISSIVVYEGPGSFTGLRIGISVANALAYAQSANIVCATGDDWVTLGLTKLKDPGQTRMITPDYGAPVHITTPKK